MRNESIVGIVINRSVFKKMSPEQTVLERDRPGTAKREREAKSGQRWLFPRRLSGHSWTASLGGQGTTWGQHVVDLEKKKAEKDEPEKVSLLQLLAEFA